jgi:hypothetical protein
MAAVTHTDYAWNRLTRTIDLTGVSAAAAPTFRTQLLWDTEEGYDHAVLEAHTAGADDWTTLPEKGGATSTTVPAECEAGFFIQGHPALTRYATAGELLSGTSGIDNLLDWLGETVRLLGVPSITDLGINAADHESIAEQAAKASSTKGNPIALSTAQLVAVLRAA